MFKNFSKSRYKHLFLAIFFLIFGIIAHFWQNYIENFSEKNQNISQTESKTAGIIEATQERVNLILDDAEVQKTLERIEKDDGYYNKDGAIFMNREKRLPVQSDREYYAEWTVKTPNEKTRGKRRIVVGK